MLNNSRRLLLLLFKKGLQHDGLLRMALPQGLYVCSTQVAADQSQQMQQQIQQQAHVITPGALRSCASKAFRSKQKPSGKHKKHSLRQQTSVDGATVQQQQQQQQRGAVNGSSSSSSRKGISKSLPEPGPLVLPDLAVEQAAAAAAAAAPRFGRVPPSSAAAAAAAAAALNVQPGRKDNTTAAAAAAGAAGFTRHRKRSPQDAPTAAAAADGPTAADVDDDAEKPWPFPPLPTHLQPRQNVLPWEVVDKLSQSSPFTLQKMVDGGIRNYISYMRAARMGVPTVFDLGIVKEQGYLGRRHLLQRERVLELLLQQLQGSNSGSSSSSGGECETPPQQQQQQQQWHVLTSASWEPSDEQLQELTQEQVEAAAAAAVADWNVVLLGDITADYVSQCLVDYFVFKRCMEVLLYKRQYRLAIKARHQISLEEYQQQQQQPHQQQQQQQGTQQQEGSDASVTLLSLAELKEVTVWDAFFDATYEDYMRYLIAAGEGHPSVFNTSRDHILDARNPPPTPQQQQQQQKQQQREDRPRQKAVRQYQQACQALTAEARVMHLFPDPMRQRPGHVTAHQLLLAAIHGEVDPEAIVSVFEDFHECKRKAFRDALEEVLRAAGSSEAARNMSRF